MSIEFETYFEDRLLTPRPQQTEILLQLEDNWEKYDYFCIDAPTGVGKTHLALAIAEQFPKNYILTATKMLQDQYVDHSVKVVDLKGRGNYTCSVDTNFSVDAAPCVVDKKLKARCLQSNTCPYYSRRDRALKSQIMLTNYSYFLYANYCGPLSEDKDRACRDVLIMDEAHELEDHLVNFAELVLSLDELEKYDIECEDLNFTMDSKHNWDVLGELETLISQKVAEHKREIEGEFGTDDMVKTISKAMASRVKSLNSRLNFLDKILQRFIIYRKSYAEDPKNWIHTPIPQDRKMVISPISANGLFMEYMHHTAEKFIFMSATMPPAKVLAKELGIDESEIFSIKTSSPFPPEKSPIVSLPMANLSYRNLDANIPNVIKGVTAILNEYEGEKGIIHTGNYKLANAIYYGVDEELRGRLICKIPDTRKRMSNEELIELHKMSDENTVLLSPSMTTGVDLPGDLSRFQIVVKLPWMSLGDPRVKKKSGMDQAWYESKMWMTLMQSTGRSTRSSEDYCFTYVLDDKYPEQLSKYKGQLPLWYEERNE